MIIPRTRNGLITVAKRPRICCLLLAVIVLTGCGDGGIKVEGTVSMLGTPYGSGSRNTNVVKVALRPVENGTVNATAEKLASWIATVDQTGQFSIDGVPKGEYFALVSDFDSYPSRDRLAAFFRNNPDKFRIQVNGQEPIQIDLELAWQKQK